MKKIIIATLSLFMVIAFTTMASATGAEDNGLATTGGEVLTIASTTGPGHSFTPSSSTNISTFTSDTVYTIIAASAKTKTTNGIEYGAVYNTNQVYQMQQAGDATVQTAAATLPSGFVNKAGVTAPQ